MFASSRLFRSTLFGLGIALTSVALLLLAFPTSASPLADDGLGVPLRTRDFTFPGFLVLGFAPAPAAALGRGNFAVEYHLSVVNDFQASNAVEDYLATRGGPPRRLDAADAQAILALDPGSAFYIDGEFRFVELAAFWGVTKNLDLGVSAYAISFAGGGLDGTIFDFHKGFGFGQQGRDFVDSHEFQVVIGTPGINPAVVLEGGESGGISDPSLFVRYALPWKPKGWRFGAVLGAKAPLANEEAFLSTGSWDVGLQLTADKRWERNAVIFNLSVVDPGDFEQSNFAPPLLPALHVSWIHRFKRFENTRFMLQGLLAEHPFRDLVDSELSALEVQLTTALKWDTRFGVFGLGLTENLLNHDNTIDIGLHFTWGFIGRQDT